MTSVDEREPLLARGDALWQELCAALDASLHTPLGPSTGWTGHDVYAHFARWQAQTLADLRRLLAGQAPVPVEGTEDEINERWRAEDCGAPTATIRERAMATRAELRATMDTLTAEQWTSFGQECAQDITEAHLSPHLAMIGK